jgi:putative hydrolase of the HAD superfamily
VTPPLPRPKAVLFDLFHTLISVPPVRDEHEPSVGDIVGVPNEEWARLYFVEDVLRRCHGDVHCSVEAMRRVVHAIDPSVPEERIVAAVESKRRRFERGFVGVEAGMTAALDRLRAAGVKTALVSDAGADDVEHWPLSPLAGRFDAEVFSYKVRVRKPDRRIYEHALAAVGVAPRDAVFVGDGGSDEHRGARAVGIKTVLVTRLVSKWWPAQVVAARPHADWEFADVPAFVEALPL